MMRPYDIAQFFDQIYWENYNPIIPYNVLAISIDTGMIKVGNGTSRWSELPYSGSTTIGSKPLESGTPGNNNTFIFSESNNEWQYRLIGCADIASNWGSSTTIYEQFTLLIENDDITGLPTGRFKIGDGATAFPTLPWFGADFDTSLWSAGESIEFNGTYFEPATYLKSTELQAATTPVGKFHKDDGTWAYLTDLDHLDTIESDYAAFGTIYVGGFPTESTTVTLTSDGTSLFVDGSKAWTQYNDGSGSGLDADTLDGYHYTAFPTTPSSGVAGNLVAFGASPNILVDSEVDPTTLATVTYVDETFPTVPSTTVVGNIVTFNSTDGLELVDSGSSVSDFATTGDIPTNYTTYHGSSETVPATYAPGDEYYNTGDSKFYKYNGTDWVALN